MSPRCSAGFCVLLVILLSLATTFTQANQEDHAAPLRSEITAAKKNGIAFLQQMQGRNGEWEGEFNPAPRDENKQAGATALCALALIENGVSVQDNRIQSAADVVRQMVRNPAFNYNYSVCLALLFLQRLHGGENYKHSDTSLIRDLAGRIVAGQMEDGGWGYKYPWTNSDNSNTQFAAIALWIARNYEVQGVRKALALTATRFRNSQKENGGWGYQAGPPNARGFTTGSMTCAALLGLALDAGLQREALVAKFKAEGAGGELDTVVSNLERDKQIVAAKSYLATVLKNIEEPKPDELHPAYFLWSLERVATLYGWQKINGVEWYATGARYLINKQNRDGSWDLDKDYPLHIDTAFALLFLAKTNVLGKLEQVAVFVQGGLGNSTPPVKPKSPPTKEEIAKRAQELFSDLQTAIPTDRAVILEEIERLPGEEYDLLLAKTILKLSSPTAQKQARATLQRRLRRFPAKSLAVHLQGRDNRELRLAAIGAVPFLNEQQLVPDLIPLVEDPDKEIADAAHQSLMAISHLNLPKTVQAWTRWYEMSKKK